MSAPPVLRRLRDVGHDVTFQPELAPVTLVEGELEGSAVERVNALGGAERTLLLRHLAQVHPDMVEAAVAWLDEYHQAARERQRVARNSKSKERRRRRGTQG